MSDTLLAIKLSLIDHCLQSVNDRILDITSTIHELKDAQQNETKSSAGDKFETSREMMQADIDKLQSQLMQLAADQNLLKVHRTLKTQDTAKDGSLVKTDKGYFLISAGLGRIKIKSHSYFVISQNAPIAKPLLHLKSGDSFSFNNVHYQIESIV